MRRVLIVNADDFGQSEGINRGVTAAFTRGIVTSASLMVRRPAAVEAAAFARQHRCLSVGLHIDLGEWVYQGGQWHSLDEVIPLEDASVVGEELGRQLERFRTLIGHEPTHLDSHQHVHLRPLVRDVVSGVANRLGVPLRSVTPGIRYCGDFYGQTAEGSRLPGHITKEHLVALLHALPAGVTELACHPGLDDTLATMYREERKQELHVLCDPGLRHTLTELEIDLRSFADVGHGLARRD